MAADDDHLFPPSQSQSRRRRPRVSLEEVQRRIDLYDSLADEFGWSKLWISNHKNVQQRQRYRRKHETEQEEEGFIVLDCWPTTGVIGSYLKHPTQGKTQLFRRACHDDDDDDINNNNINNNNDYHDSVVTSIFENPRAHTGKGYQRRAQLEHQHNNDYRAKRGRSDYDAKYDDGDDDDDAMRIIMTREDGGEENDVVKLEQDEEDYGQHRARKRRRLACPEGQRCRNYECAYSHPPRCFYGIFCWFQPNCWFDHTHGLCRYGNECDREDCWFSHRNPAFYY